MMQENTAGNVAERLATLPQWEFEAFWPLLEVPEPSGLCYHPQRNTLFIVDDGDINRPAALFEIDLEAQVLQMTELGIDLEGVCYCSLDGLLYVAEEAGEKLYAVEPDGLEHVGTVSYSRKYDGEELLRAGGNGVEGIEWIPDEAEPEAGYFILLNQDDPHCLFRLNHEDLDFEKGKPAPIRAWWPTEPINAGSLHYIAEKRELWLIHSWMNVMQFIDIDTMEATGFEVFPGAAQEAVALDGEGRLWVGSDLGSIARYTRAEPE